MWGVTFDVDVHYPLMVKIPHTLVATCWPVLQLLQNSCRPLTSQSRLRTTVSHRDNPVHVWKTVPALIIFSFSFSSASINSIQLQPSHQGHCSGPCSCVFTRVRSKMLFTFSVNPQRHPSTRPRLPLLFLVRSQTECIHAGRFNCKQCLGCRCRLWVTFTLAASRRSKKQEKYTKREPHFCSSACECIHLYFNWPCNFLPNREIWTKFETIWFFFQNKTSWCYFYLFYWLTF